MWHNMRLVGRALRAVRFTRREVFNTGLTNIKIAYLIGLRICTASCTPSLDFVSFSKRTFIFEAPKNFCIECKASSEKCMDQSVITSVHGDHIKEVHNVPMNVIIRPFPSELDEDKVNSLMKTLQESSATNTVPPVDIMWVKGRLGGNYYYSFGGCHRHEAHRRLQRETIRAKLIKTNIDTLRAYLGSSTPDLK